MSDGLNRPNAQDTLVEDTLAENAYAELDRTLLRIAHAPVPEGLKERVKARLAAAPRQGRLLAWPMRAWPVRMKAEWLRTAAAAAIVAVVAGGGWGVYSHVYSHMERPQAVKAIGTPTPAAVSGAASGGMSSAGAMRVPLTLDGPIVNHAVKNAGKNAGKKHPGKLTRKAQAAAAAAK